MRFEQFQPGMIIDGGHRVVTEAEIIEFAKRYDPQFFHVDPVRGQPVRALIDHLAAGFSKTLL